jgi:hypothetical protein
LCAPFLFNPVGFGSTKAVDDWKEWNKRIRQQGGLGIHQDKSWNSWWYDEQAHLRDQVLVRGLPRYCFLFVSLSISMVWSITLTSLSKAKTCWLYLFMVCDSWNIPLGEGKNSLRHIKTF